MEKPFNYQAMPYDFAHCLNETCLRADQCLRRQMAICLPQERETFLIVNHQRLNPDGANCTYFVKNEPKRYAKGISTMLNSLPYAQTVALRQELVHSFGKTLYYRFYRKEMLISPEQQLVFQRIFQKKGIDVAPLFDEYVERYD